MIEIDITSDVEAAMVDLDRVMYRQIPYAIARTINDVLERTRERVITTTYRNAFNVRNTRFAGVNFTIDRVLLSNRQGSPDVGVARSLSDFKHGRSNEMVGRLRQRNFPKGGVREYFENHAEGGTKVPRGNTIAVPAQPDRAGLRTGSGKVKAVMRPERITHRRDTFLIRDKSGKKRFIARRVDRAKLDFIYFFARTAQIKKHFRFYEDSHDTIIRLFSPTFQREWNMVVNGSPFLN